MTPIAASRCLSGRDLTEPRLSPDGAWVVVVTSARSGPVLVLVPTGGGPERHLTTSPAPRPARGFGGGCHAWLADSSGVVYAAADGELWIQSLGSSDPVQLTTFGRSAFSPAVSPDGSFVAFVLDEAEVWTLEVASGAANRLDDGGAAFCADPTVAPDGRTVWWVGWNPPAMPWDRAALHHSDGGTARVFEVPASVQQPVVDCDGRLVCVRDDTGWLNVWRDDAPVLDEPLEHAGPSWGPGQRSFALSPDGCRIAFTRNENGFGRLCVVDVATRAVTSIARGVHGALDWRGDTLVAIRSGARTPTQVVSHDMSRPDLPRRVLAVGPAASWDGDAALVEPEPLVATAADGAEVFARLYRSPAADGRLICWVHGGPTDQWQVTFLPRVAYWVSRGVSVLVVDHRGSTGHGRAYQQAMNARWGDLDVTDTAALLEAAHAVGGGEPGRSVAMGGSAGGLTALLLAARRPDLVRAVVASYPVCDIGALDDTTHRFEAHYNDVLIGPRHDPAAVLARRERSPLAATAALAAVPVLLLHGDADPVVPIDQSRALAAALVAAGGDVELVEYPGEGHGFRQPSHQLDEYARITAFLERTIAGGE